MKTVIMSGVGYFLFFLFAFLSLTVLLIWPVFPYVILGILLTYLFHPLERRLQKLIHSASVRAGLLTLLTTLLISYPFGYAVQRVTRELGSQAQIDRMQGLLEASKLWLANHNAQFLANWLAELVVQGQNFILGNIPNLFGSVFDVTLGIFVCLFVFYYFTKQGSVLWSGIMEAIPLSIRVKAGLTQEVTSVLRAIIYGQMMTALIQGSVGGIGLLIFQVPQPFILTLLMIFLSFLPFIGAPLVWGPAAILKLMAGDTWQGLGLLIYGVVLVLNIDNLLRPRLIALHSQVHPVVVLIGIIGGTKVFGFVGFLVGPLIFAIFIQLMKFFVEYQSQDTLTPPPRTPTN